MMPGAAQGPRYSAGAGHVLDDDLRLARYVLRPVPDEGAGQPVEPAAARHRAEDGDGLALEIVRGLRDAAGPNKDYGRKDRQKTLQHRDSPGFLCLPRRFDTVAPPAPVAVQVFAFPGRPRFAPGGGWRPRRVARQRDPPQRHLVELFFPFRFHDFSECNAKMCSAVNAVNCKGILQTTTTKRSRRRYKTPFFWAITHLT